jgi:endoglucanase
MARKFQLNDAWKMYTERFISPEGRVIDNANGDISHSEGQGYAMLIAARLNDRATFARLWDWSRTMLFIRDDHLAAWVWDPQTRPHTRDIDDASDGNLLIAWALTEAGTSWGNTDYIAAAQNIAGDVAALDTSRSRFGLVLLPGSHGFSESDRPDGPVVNLSYWVFPAFSHLKKVAPAADWDGIVASGLSIIMAARFGSERLPTDWISLADGKIASAQRFPRVFGYDAIRIPLYLAWFRPSNLSTLSVFSPLLTRDRMRAPSVIDIQTGKAKERLGGEGYRSITALLDCALHQTRLPDDFYTVRSELYYPTTLHFLAILAALESYPTCIRS